ncbi:MAG TPA: hypothetical protein VF974_01585 [Patescibacteria group bacterium]
MTNYTIYTNRLQSIVPVIYFATIKHKMATVSSNILLLYFFSLRNTGLLMGVILILVSFNLVAFFEDTISTFCFIKVIDFKITLLSIRGWPMLILVCLLPRVGIWIKDAVSTALDNAKKRIATGNTIPQKMFADFMANPMAFLDGGEEFELMRAALGLSEGVKGMEEMKQLANDMGWLREASEGRGNYTLGDATAVESDRLGKIWVGDNYRIASDGKTLVSQDGTHVYMPPSAKPNSPYATTGVQSNFEILENGKKLGNGHVNINP